MCQLPKAEARSDGDEYVMHCAVLERDSDRIEEEHGQYCLSSLKERGLAQW
jgi:hypothetical protein